MKALSVRAPWWWFILHAGKDIENRDWSTNFRGTIFLHSSKWWKLEEVAWDGEDAIHIAGWKEERHLWPKVDEIKAARGCIVGMVDIVGCVNTKTSPWFFGKYGFVLANPVAFDKPIPCKGHLGFFDVDWAELTNTSFEVWKATGSAEDRAAYDKLVALMEKHRG